MSLALQRDVARQVAVLIPAAVIELDEAHVALGQPPREQAVARRSVPGLRDSGPYSSKTSLRLLREVRQLGHATSASGTPSRTARCASRSPDRRTRSCCIVFSFADGVEHLRGASSCSMPGGIVEIQHRVAAGAEPHALIARRQEPAAPQPREQRLIGVDARAPARSARRTPAGSRSRCPARS